MSSSLILNLGRRPTKPLQVAAKSRFLNFQQYLTYFFTPPIFDKLRTSFSFTTINNIVVTDKERHAKADVHRSSSLPSWVGSLAGLFSTSVVIL